MSGYNPKFDINFARDYSQGEISELWAADVVEKLRNGTVEVKRDMRVVDTGNIYVEYECKTVTGWGPSGINKTEAVVYLFHIVDDFALVIASDRLRQVMRQIGRKNRMNGSYSTHAAVIPITEMISLLLREGWRD